MRALRPSLKAQLRSEPEPLPFASCPNLLMSPHVHFPPTPTLTSTYFADSPWTYDRAPIATSPNSCALPERGGRIYIPTSESSQGYYFQPRASEACAPEPSVAHITIHSPPPLFADVSSESEESDAHIVTPPDPTTMIPSISAHFSHHNQLPSIPSAHSQEAIDNALSFLPHPSKSKRNGRKGNPSRTRLEVRVSCQGVDTFTELALDGCLGGF